MQVGDARWRSSQTAGTDVVQGLLNSLQTYTDLLKPDELDEMHRQGLRANSRQLLSLSKRNQALPCLQTSYVAYAYS